MIATETDLKNLKIEITAKKKKIMKYLQLGINIPILPQFEKYILRNLERYSDVKSILLKEKIVNSRFGRNSDIISGNCLVFNHSGDNTQYFGYFGV